jgi:hypothetical protein
MQHALVLNRASERMIFGSGEGGRSKASSPHQPERKQSREEEGNGGKQISQGNGEPDCAGA